MRDELKECYRPRRRSLYECISEMKKDSPSGYDAETGEESAGSESSPGEPNEYHSLYRIRRSQENHQFLRQDRRGEIVEEGSVPGRNSGTGKLGDRRDCPHFISESRILSSARHSPLRIPPQN